MMRLNTRSRIILAAVFGLALLAVVCFALLIGTEAGTRFVLRQAHGFLPESVTIGAVHGRLIGPLTWEGIDIRTETARLHIQRVELEWSPAALLGRRLDIHRLTLDGIRYVQLANGASKPETDAKPQQLPDAIALPVDVGIEVLELRRIEVRPEGPSADPVRIEKVAMAVAIDEDKTRLSKIAVQAADFEVTGRLGMGMKHNFPVDGDLTWGIHPPDYAKLEGRTVIQGRIGELKLRQTIAPPYGIDLTLLVEGLPAPPRFTADVKAHPDRLDRLGSALPQMEVALQAAVQGSADALSLRLSGVVKEADLGTADLRLEAGLRSDTLFIDRLLVSISGQPAQVTAAGEIPLKGEQRFRFRAEWSRLQWPLQQPRFASPEGQVEVNGRLDDYAVALSAEVYGPEKTAATVQLNGRGSRQALDLTRIEMKTLEGGIAGTAGIGWSPELRGSADLTGKGLNPGVLFDGWPGDLRMQLSAQGHMANGTPDIRLKALKADGRLRGHPFSLDVMGAYEKGRAAIERFTVVSGTTRLEAQGEVGQTANLSWTMASEDLSTLHAGAKGRIRGKGRVTGPLRRPRCDVELDARDLAYAAYRLKSLMLDADVDLSAKDRSSVSLHLSDGAAPGLDLREVRLEGHGDAAAHAVILAADTSQGTVDLEINGALRRPWQADMAWHFTAVKAILAYPELAAWTLAPPLSGKVSGTDVLLSPSCWRSGAARLCFSVQRAQEKVLAEVDINRLPLTYFSPYLPEGVDLRGDLDGKGTYEQIGRSEPTAVADLRTSPVSIWVDADTLTPPKKAAKVIEFLPGSVRLDWQADGVEAAIVLPVSETDGVRLEAVISPGSRALMDRPLKGHLRTAFQNLAFIEAWLPEVEDLSGRLTGDVTISGSLRNPALNGRLELAGGAATFERPGLELRQVGISLAGEENGAIRLTGRAVSGQGHINIDGTADLRHDTPFADLRIKGENFTVSNTEQARVETSPDLNVRMARDRIDVQGEVIIPKATIELKKLPPSAVEASDDQVIADTAAEPAEESRDRNIHARVRISLGEAVFFNGFGLSAGIRGGLLAVEKPGEPTTGSGELRIVDGTYEAFGQKLEVEKGRVLFAGGPIDRPGIDARAVRRPAEDILVGVNVRGDLRQPEVTLFSDPAMTQGNQLSYLVLGRPLSGASTGEGSALSRAVLALGLKGGNAVAEKIGGQLGLDEFTVASNGNGNGSDAEQASLVIGKYLTPKLYINYGIGLFDPVSTLRLQYAISSKWKLVTESSGTASGGDIIYTIETGR